MDYGYMSIFGIAFNFWQFHVSGGRGKCFHEEDS